MQIINKYLKSTSLIMAVVLLLTLFVYPVNSVYATSKTSFGDKVSASVEEFKSSFDGAFTPKWFLSKFGIQMGYHLIDCIQNKKSPSVKAVIKSMMTADYFAGAAGGLLGGAVGSLFVPLVSTVPIFGGLLADMVPTVAYYLGADIAHGVVDDAKTGKFSIKNVFKNIDWISVVTGGIGWSAGSMLGAAIFPPIGSMVGGIVGDLLMAKVGDKIRTFFGKTDNSPPDTTVQDGGPLSLGVTSSEIKDTTFASSSSASSASSAYLPEETPVLNVSEQLVQLNIKYQQLYKECVSSVNDSNANLSASIDSEIKLIKQQIQKLSN